MLHLSLFKGHQDAVGRHVLALPRLLQLISRTLQIHNITISLEVEVNTAIDNLHQQDQILKLKELQQNILGLLADLNLELVE